MSIPKSERKPSKFEILEMAKKIRSALCDLAIRDFGIKDRKRCSKRAPKQCACCSSNALSMARTCWYCRTC